MPDLATFELTPRVSGDGRWMVLTLRSMECPRASATRLDTWMLLDRYATRLWDTATDELHLFDGHVATSAPRPSRCAPSAQACGRWLDSTSPSSMPSKAAACAAPTHGYSRATS